jgi:hypothetical protein
MSLTSKSELEIQRQRSSNVSEEEIAKQIINKIQDILEVSKTQGQTYESSLLMKAMRPLQIMAGIKSHTDSSYEHSALHLEALAKD